MEQVLFGGYDNALNATQTEGNHIFGGMSWTQTIYNAHNVVSTDGVIKHLRIKLNGAPSAGKHYDFTLVVNGAPTALTLEIADTDTEGNDMVHEIDVSAGDMVYLQCNPDGSPTTRYARWTMVFEGDTANESLIMGGTGGADNVNLEYAPVMHTGGGYSVTEDDHRQVCPTAGTIKNFYVSQSGISGNTPEDNYRYRLRKNGANTALIVTIPFDQSTGSDLVHTVAVVAGDILTISIEPLGTPNTRIPNWGFTFVASVDGESIVMGGSSNDLNDTNTEYNRLTGVYGLSWASEAARYMLGQECAIKKLYMLLSAPPTAGKKYDFTLRVGGASSNVVATVSDAATTGNSGALEDTVADDDYVTIQVIPDSTPDVADAYWGFVCYTGAPPVEGKPISSSIVPLMRIEGMLATKVPRKLPRMPNFGLKMSKLNPIIF